MSERREGLIGVLVSRGFGAGWSTWNRDFPDCLYDAEIVNAVVSGTGKERIETIAKYKWPDGYWGGADGLTVYWLAPGTAFRIDEYDGNESITLASEEVWSIVPSSPPVAGRTSSPSGE